VLEQQPGEGKQRALARCLAASIGEIVVLTDADCLLSDGQLESLVAPIASGEFDVATGYSEPWAEQRGIAMVSYQWLSELGARPGAVNVPGVLGRNCAVRRSVVEKLRAFDAPAPTGTDYVLGQLLRRAGYPVRSVPDSSVLTRFPETVGTYLSTWRRWIKNILVHAPRLGDRRETRAVLVTVGLAAATAGGIVLAPFTGLLSLAASLALVALATISRIRRLRVGARRANMGLPVGAVAFAPVAVALDTIAILLATVDALAPARRRRW
jgi:hypothetical protein